MILRKTVALLSLTSWLFAVTLPAGAAPRPRTARRPSAVGGTVVTGIVVAHKGNTPVAGARVHFASHRTKHHHHSKTKSTVKPATQKTRVGAKAAALRARVRHTMAKGVLTNSSGQFALKGTHAGSRLIVAHKKHVGSGHARVTLAAASPATPLTIHLHKHHHSHTKVAGAKKKAKA